MDNTYYILSKDNLTIERFHFCTWDISKKPYIEFGVELTDNCFQNKNELILYFTNTFFNKGIVVKCLMENLSDEANCRFIFNDVVKSMRPLDGDKRNGNIYEFESRNKLTIIPCEVECKEGYFIIKIKKPCEIDGNIYFRFLIQLDVKHISEVKKSITKKNHIYDVKVNENRNIPNSVFLLKKEEGLYLCKISRMFCLHTIPDIYEINFVASSVLKNIRKLETDSFKKYIPSVESINNNNSNIIFLKSENAESYSFFTILTEESISSVQLAFAVATNILCSLLFAISSIRYVRETNLSWWKQIPCECYIAGSLFLLLVIYLLTPLKKKLKL